MRSQTRRVPPSSSHKAKHPIPFFILLLAGLILSACAPQPTTQAPVLPTTVAATAAPTDTAVPSTPTVVEAKPFLPANLETINAANAARLQQVAEIPLAAVWQLSFSPDGKKLAVGLGNGGVEIWDLTNGQKSLSLEGHAENKTYPGRIVNYLAFSPDGKLLSRAEYKPAFNDAVIVWDLSSGAKVSTLDVLNAAISPDWRVLATVPLDSGVTARLTDYQSGAELGLLHDPTELGIMDLEFSPNGRNLVLMSVGVEELRLSVWDVPSAQLLVTMDNMLRLAFSPDGKLAANESNMPDMNIYDTASWAVMRVLAGDASLGSPTPRFSPDGGLLAEGFGKQIKLVDTASWTDLVTLPSSGNLLVFSPDVRLVATFDGTEGKIMLWGVTP